MAIAVKSYAKANIKVFWFCPTLLIFYYLQNILPLIASSLWQHLLVWSEEVRGMIRLTWNFSVAFHKLFHSHSHSFSINQKKILLSYFYEGVSSMIGVSLISLCAFTMALAHVCNCWVMFTKSFIKSYSDPKSITNLKSSGILVLTCLWILPLITSKA